MKTIKLVLGPELNEGVSEAVKEFHYPSKSEYIRDAIRNKLKDSKFEREKEKLWHTLLAKHGHIYTKKEDMEYRPRFSLRDLLRHNTE